MWVAIALDNVAGRTWPDTKATPPRTTLYATLNHATPLVTWCEERGPSRARRSARAIDSTCGRQSPSCVHIRDMFVMEETLQLALGLPRHWVGGGKATSTAHRPTSADLVPSCQVQPSRLDSQGHI